MTNILTPEQRKWIETYTSAAYHQGRLIGGQMVPETCFALDKMHWLYFKSAYIQYERDIPKEVRSSLTRDKDITGTFESYSELMD